MPFRFLWDCTHANSLTDFSFIFVASYIEISFMILPIFNALDDLDENIEKRKN